MSKYISGINWPLTKEYHYLSSYREKNAINEQ